MSEYEMIAAAQGYAMWGMTLLMNFFTVLVAYLAAGYLAAHRLSLINAMFVTLLFAAISLNSMMVLSAIGTQLQALLVHMHEAAISSKVLLWHPVAAQVPNIWSAGMVAIVAMALASVGAVYFFFDCRRHNQRAASFGTPHVAT
jgi:hypothetical protein